jgi:hypothetical protein
MTADRILKEARRAKPGARVKLAPSSLAEAQGVTYAFMEIGGEPFLCAAGKSGCGKGFERPDEINGAAGILLCPATHANAEELRRRLPFTAPSPLSGVGTTIGLGDRLGMAGRGHIRAIRPYRASPVLAQQSVRELTLTGRSFSDVLDSSTWAVFAEGFRAPWGADGDHLKAEDKVREAVSAGFTMITADVSDSMAARYTEAGEGELEAVYGRLDEALRKDFEDRYLSASFSLTGGGGLKFSPTDLRRAVLVYGKALDHAERLYRAGIDARGGAGGAIFDFELSIDETDTPTTPHAHFFIAGEMKKRGIPVASLAPRFVGEFQKGIDYIGDVKEFEKSFAVHAEIARTLGHRISVHSGSDKFAVFPIVGRLSGGRFHLKTAGTSWLEALRVIAERDPALFRDLYAAALVGYPNARKLYHVTPDLSRLPQAEDLGDSAAFLLDDKDARRVLHIAYGELLAEPGLRRRFFAVLEKEAETYRSFLRAHIGMHLELLGVGKSADA